MTPFRKTEPEKYQNKLNFSKLFIYSSLNFFLLDSTQNQHQSYDILKALEKKQKVRDRKDQQAFVCIFCYYSSPHHFINKLRCYFSLLPFLTSNHLKKKRKITYLTCSAFLEKLNVSEKVVNAGYFERTPGYTSLILHPCFNTLSLYIVGEDLLFLWFLSIRHLSLPVQKRKKHSWWISGEQASQKSSNTSPNANWSILIFSILKMQIQNPSHSSTSSKYQYQSSEYQFQSKKEKPGILQRVLLSVLSFIRLVFCGDKLNVAQLWLWSAIIGTWSAFISFGYLRTLQGLIKLGWHIIPKALIDHTSS